MGQLYHHHLDLFDIDGFTPLVNLRDSAILGVGRIVREAVMMDDDTRVARH